MSGMASSILHHLLLRPPPSSILFIKPLTLSRRLPTPPGFCCTSSSSSSVTYPPQTLSPPLVLQEDDDSEQQSEAPIAAKPPPPSSLPSLTVKEKKELASYAHSLGKKLKVQQVGKSGVTDSVAASFVENLESNELLKLKIHNNCPGELPDVIKQLEATTGSVAVGQIGRSVILYRPSLTKLRAEEKKREARRVYVRKGFRPRPTVFRVKPAESRSKSDETMEKRGRTPKLPSRGHRGSSRQEVP